MGFQSFSDSGEVEFLEGINLLIGQNNAGKSAFLRALLPGLPDDRHRTPEKWETHRLRQPEVSLTIDASGAEIHDWLLRSSSPQFIPVLHSRAQDLDAFFREFFGLPRFALSIIRTPGNNFSAPDRSHQLFHHTHETPQLNAMMTSNNSEITIQGTASNYKSSLPELLFNAWNRDMFYFAAERMAIGENQSGHASRLDQNARNLPNVLHTLSSERGNVFQHLVDHLREVFSTVGNLSVRTKPSGNQLEVLVWPTKEMERVELSFPLNSSGTGVAQVIALLTAIMTIDNAVIIIDEINSFLHPAAIKALLRILQTQYAQHQYIISTHSPEVIACSNPKTIHLVKRAGYESSIKRLDLAKVEDFREVAEHLGVSMADVFAADRVIWVEGPTEELCFPYLYQELKGPLPRGTIITSVAATGDFNTRKRDRAIVFEVYNRLSAAAATLVVSVAFSFDTEKLTDSEKAEMQQQAHGLLHFLPRRHLECYLIEPAAIAAFIINKDPASAQTVTSSVVEVALRAAAAERPFHEPQWNGDITNADWLAHVDAANLIASVCGTLSEQRAPFVKKDDSLFLLRHILEHDRAWLEPLGDYVASLVDAVKKKS
jgi:predicted ATPase